MVVFHRVHRELLSHTIGNTRDTHPGKLMVVFHKSTQGITEPYHRQLQGHSPWKTHGGVPQSMWGTPPASCGVDGSRGSADCPCWGWRLSRWQTDAARGLTTAGWPYPDLNLAQPSNKQHVWTAGFLNSTIPNTLDIRIVSFFFQVSLFIQSIIWHLLELHRNMYNTVIRRVLD